MKDMKIGLKHTFVKYLFLNKLFILHCLTFLIQLITQNMSIVLKVVFKISYLQSAKDDVFRLIVFHTRLYF